MVKASMTLYHCMSARSFRPLWMLEELGLPYKLEMLPFPPRSKAPTYLAVNPLGTIPAFFDGATRDYLDNPTTPPVVREANSFPRGVSEG